MSKEIDNPCILMVLISYKGEFERQRYFSNYNDKIFFLKLD